MEVNKMPDKVGEIGSTHPQMQQALSSGEIIVCITFEIREEYVTLKKLATHIF